MTDIDPCTAEVTQATIADRALGDKPSDVCINPVDEIVAIDMTKLATDTTPYTDIEAEMARKKLRKPEYPVNFQQHCERKAITHTPTTPGFMDILDKTFQQFMDSLQPKYALITAPASKPVEKPAQPAKVEWTVASVKQWLEQREESTRTAFENAKIDKKRATADDIRNVCSAITKLGGKRYPYLIDDLNCIRVLELNTDEKLVDMLKTLNRQLWGLYASHAKVALGDGAPRRL